MQKNGLKKIKRNNMNSDRIKEIQMATAYPDSQSVQQALLQVWNECQQERMYSEDEVRKLFNQYKEYFSIYRNEQILNVEFEDWFEQNKKI
jgi:hypothetical protein